ncbi:hypothetical protein IJI55_00645 [Candidatus Saccharibacteria bacterium]|nr:hypothetical protein [Candidatus Saccharibacteria bacterium]
MGKKNFLQRLIILPILGLLFATFSGLINPLPAYAEPETSSNNTFVENLVGPTEETQSTTQETDKEKSAFLENLTGPTEESSSNEKSSKTTTEEEETPDCYEVVGGLGWIICPVVSVVSSGVDALYDIINNFLAIEPITFNENSSTYIVWAIARDIANIVFIILILVVIFSQVTGIGFDNYNIKKTLPRIIIAAILVNLSFLICSLAVDSSNIIGASVKGLFDSIANTVKQNSTELTGELSWAAIVGQIIGTIGTGAGATAIAGGAIALSGGLGHFIWLLIPVVLGAIISLAIGVFTIALRQAVVSLLVMLAPLAFVAYLLPNTEGWFKKWKDILIQMLIFFPMFAALYGASNLAGWTFITNGVHNGSVIEIIVGMAIQVFPLIMSFKLLQMSDTVLGKVNETLTKWSQPAQNALKNFSITQAATAKAKYDANNLSRKYTGINSINPARLRSFAARRQHEIEENRKQAEERRQSILSAYTYARQMNKQIEFDQNGRLTMSQDTKTNGMTEAMRLAMQNKEAGLNLSGLQLERDNALNQAGTYATNNNIQSTELRNIVSRQADNWLDYKTQTNAKRRNDLGDEQFYASEVLRASKQSHDSENYQRLIVKGGGINALNTKNKALQNSALTSVISNAYDITEAEREADIKRLTNFFNTQPTENVEAELKNAMHNNDVNSIIAGLNILNARGDGDKVAKYTRQFMDSEQLKLGTEYANNLAKSMLAYGENPLIKGVGKFINVETLAYTEGRRQNNAITFKEFITGAADFDNIKLDTNGNPQAYTPKYDIISTIRGKDFTSANRTTMKAIMEAMVAYNDDPSVSNELMEQRILELDNQIRPQLVSSIPTYNSGSEEIIAAVKYLTGYVPDGNGGWKFNGKIEGANGEDIQLSQEFFHQRTTKYLSAFTPNDLIKMKSDVLAATKQLFADVNNHDAAAAKSEFQKIFANKEAGGNDALSTLLAGDLSNIGAMKSGLRDMLDLDSEHLPATLAKYGIKRKTK